MEKCACSYLDLLAAAQVLIQRLTGLRYRLPHVRDDLCYLEQTDQSADGWKEAELWRTGVVESATYSLDAPLGVRDEGEELLSEEEDQRGRSLCESQHLLQHCQNALPRKHNTPE